MIKVKLVMGNLNYSSWSLRAWLCLAKSGAPFEELVIPLDTPQFAEEIAEYSPTARVPVLWDDGQCIWDSLAICEYINDRFAGGGMWPSDVYSRGLGRAMAAEMHSGFAELRNQLPMNIRAHRRAVTVSEDLQRDIDRIYALWGDALACHRDRGPWLLGDFSIADAMFAPVVMRLQSYDVPIPDDIQAYCQHVLADPNIQDWRTRAMNESWVIDAEEVGA